MPTAQLVLISGVWVWEVSGLGITITHQQRAQAQLLWYTRAVAKGYQGEPPRISP
jgi:hypothetical protein